MTVFDRLAAAAKDLNSDPELGVDASRAYYEQFAAEQSRELIRRMGRQECITGETWHDEGTSYDRPTGYRSWRAHG